LMSCATFRYSAGPVVMKVEISGTDNVTQDAY